MPHSADDSSAASSIVLTLSTAPSSAQNPATPAATTTLTLPPRNDSDRLSPGVAGFSFPDLSSDSAGQASNLDSTAGLPRHRERQNMVRDDRSDASSQQHHNAILQRQESNRKRSRWYEDQFAVKPAESTAAVRVSRDAPVIAELRTNVIVKDEYTLVTDLSSHLSERFHRPESSVMVSVAHSACLMFGGTFEPAYMLTISTLPQYVQPVTNKRNAALTQAFMTEVLGVPPERGIMHFKPIAEDNMAHCGKTITAQIEHEEDPIGLKRGLTQRSMHRKSLLGEKRKSLLSRGRDEDGPQRNVSTKTAKSSKSQNFNRSNSPTLLSPEPSPNPSNGVSGRPSRDGGRPTSSGFGLSVNGQPPNIRPRSPMKPILKTTAHERPLMSPPPPIPAEKGAPKVSKRKSLVAIFKR